MKENKMPSQISNILYKKNYFFSIESELFFNTKIDKAHLIMLYQQNIINYDHLRKILLFILSLEKTNFKEILDKPFSKGVYLEYENYLIEKLGMETAGNIHIGRSRNDLRATSFLLSLREPYMKILNELHEFQVKVLNRAKRFVDIIMPIYTHYQPAVPITFGHYLSGIAEAINRNICEFINLSKLINTMPLGAGAIGGTSIFIDQNKTKELLGFEKVFLNSIDAISSKDIILRFLSELNIVASNLSRFSEDFLLWSTGEFNFITLDDKLTGGSSMMPNKKNNFLFEVIQGKSSSVIGIYMSVYTAINKTPFSNSISANESNNLIWKALEDILDVIVIFKNIISSMQPIPKNMLRRSKNSFINATELANHLVQNKNYPFRKAHKLINTLINSAINENCSLESKLIENNLFDSIDKIEDTIKNIKYGGGPGSFNTYFNVLKESYFKKVKETKLISYKWEKSEINLSNNVLKITS